MRGCHHGFSRQTPVFQPSVCTGGWSALNDTAISGAEFSTMEQVDRSAPQPRGRNAQLTARLCERGTEYGRLFRFAQHVSHAC